MREYPTIDIEATGKHIKQLMVDRGLNTKQLSEEMGLNCVSAIYRWFHGKNLPDANNLLIMAKIFGCSIDYLLVTR